MPAPCPPVTRVVVVLALRAKVSAHALQLCHAGTGIMTTVSDCAHIVFFSVVSHTVHQARPFWSEQSTCNTRYVLNTPHVLALASAALVAHLDRARQAEN